MNDQKVASDKKVAITILDLALENIDEPDSKTIQRELTDKKYGIVIEERNNNEYRLTIETGDYEDIEITTEFNEDNLGLYAEIKSIGEDSIDDLTVRDTRYENSNFEFNNGYHEN